jgi:hypothetical protein
MIKDELFNDIRPYRNPEFQEAIKSVLSDPGIDAVIKAIFPELPAEAIKAKLLGIETVDDFQKEIIYSVVQRIIKTTSAGLTYDGTDLINTATAHLYISNHRDIVLDPSLINFALFEKGFKTIEIAIGDNLLKKKWIRDLVRINKSFIVKRNLPIRELVVASRLLSDYIGTAVLENKNSVWIAQREGRAKDSNDRTHPGLINMVGMRSKENIKDYFKSLNVIPVAISYEKDPCDVQKVRELYAVKYLGGYQKGKNEDVESMKNGIMGFKSRIHIRFCSSITHELDELPEDTHRNGVIETLCSILDKQIISAYKLWPANFIAYDLLHNGDSMNQHYTEELRKDFIEDIDQKSEKINGDKNIIKDIFYQIYARSVENKLQYSDVLLSSDNG